MPVAPNARGRYPFAAKAQGAGFGAGTGVGLASVIIGAVETYGIHEALPGWASDGIAFGCAIAVALFASWWAPNQDRIPGPEPAPLVTEHAPRGYPPEARPAEHHAVRDEATGRYTASVEPVPPGPLGSDRTVRGPDA
jgi:hypothetical protein